MIPPPLRLPLVIGVVALSLAACGRRGALEPPPGTSGPGQQEQRPQVEGQPGTLAPSPVGTPRRTTTQTPPPNRPFVLDPLL